MTVTRSSDRWKMPATVAGFVILAIWGAIELLLPKDRQPGETTVRIILVLGAGLISPGFIVDLLKIWRGSGPTPPPGGAQ